MTATPDELSVLDARARALAAPAREVAVARAASLALRVAGERCAIDARCVHEVVRDVRVTPLPGATDAMNAIVAWRGMLLPVIDLHGLLGLRHGEPSDERRLVVIGGQAASRAFVADEVEGIEEDDAPVGPVPPGVAAAGPFVQGMRGTTLVLDAERLLGLEPFGG